jgi:hypothetical protein
MSWQEPGAAWQGNRATDRDWGKIRAGDVDRDHIANALGTAYEQGRLSKDEYDARLEEAFAARTYGDLDLIVSDLPIVRMAPETQVATASGQSGKVNGLAVASFIFGVAPFIVPPLGSLGAIILGHMARHQIKKTGERGAGLALAGLVLGWFTLILGITVLLGSAISVATQGAGPIH